jgi:hypothetical protein
MGDWVGLIGMLQQEVYLGQLSQRQLLMLVPVEVLVLVLVFVSVKVIVPVWVQVPMYQIFS